MDTVVWILIILIVLGVFGYFMYIALSKEKESEGGLKKYKNTQAVNRELASRARQIKSLAKGRLSFENRRQQQIRKDFW